jgi:hypothetical protein
VSQNTQQVTAEVAVSRTLMKKVEAILVFWIVVVTIFRYKNTTHKTLHVCWKHFKYESQMYTSEIQSIQ